MDFSSLLYAAQRNERSSHKEPVRCYKTSFEPAKKDSKTKTLSVNIKKFLQKKEEEERRRDEEARRKREELVALRSQDKKAQKRVQVMLKRTKSANKSVMEDAIDDVNTVVTMAGPVQPDEDDYGYVSQEASAYYNKLMDKYANMPPDEPKFPQAKKTSVKNIKEMNAAKERVRQALNRVEEEEMMPHKRKRKSKNDKSRENEDDFIDDNDYTQGSCRQETAEPPPKKPKRPAAPPPMDFSSLLKIAEQKQFEPVVIEKKVEEEERPLTKKQKIEYEREKDWKMRKEEKERNKNKPNANRIPKLSESHNKIPKLSDSQNRIPKLSETQNRIPKLSETQNKNTKLSENESRRNSSNYRETSRASQNTYRSSSNTKKYQHDEDHDRQRPLNHGQSKSIQFDRERQNLNLSKRETYNNFEQKSEENSSNSDNELDQMNNKYNNERKNSQIKTYDDKKNITDRFYSHNDYDNSRRSSYSKPKQDTGQQRNYPSSKFNQKRSSDSETSKKYNDFGDRRSCENNEQNLPRERKYSIVKSSHERSQSRESDIETSLNYRDSDDEKHQSRQNRTNKIYPNQQYSRSKMYDTGDNRQHKLKSEPQKSRSDYKHDRESMEMKSDDEQMHSPDPYDENLENNSDSDEDRLTDSKYARETSKTEYNQNKISSKLRSDQDKRRSEVFHHEISKNVYDSGNRHRTKPNCEEQYIDRNKSRSYERSNYDSEDDKPLPKSNREKSRAEIQHNRHYSKEKSGYERGKLSDDRPRFGCDKFKSSSSSETSKSQLLSDAESDRKRIPLKQDQRKFHQSIELKGDSTKKNYHNMSDDSGSEKQTIINPKLRNESQSHNIDKERLKRNIEYNHSQNINKYDSKKPFIHDRTKSRSDMKGENKNSNIEDYDQRKLLSKSDDRKGFEKNRDKSKSFIDSQERHRINERSTLDSKNKNILAQNAEERLKKGADVWSKPCNTTPPRPNPKNVINRPNENMDRQRQSSSSKQLENRNDNKERFRDKNNSSPLAKPLQGTKIIRKENSGSVSSYSDNKVSSNKPVFGGKPNLMKAAAARAAELRSQKPRLGNEKRNESLSSKPERLTGNVKCNTPNGIKPQKLPPNDLKPKQFPPTDLKPKQFPPKDVRPKQFPPSDVKRRPKPSAKRRIVDDSEEDYDSEMDDFIDDGPEDEEDYSKYISEIFGYDKSRYSHLDEEDDECMESSFAQQMKEDIRSTKIGIMEDLEDMRKEKEEKMRAMKKKMVSKSGR